MPCTKFLLRARCCTSALSSISFNPPNFSVWYNHSHFQGETKGVEKLSHLPKVSLALLLSLHSSFDSPSDTGLCNDRVLYGRLPDLSPCLHLHISWHMNVLTALNSAQPKCAATPVSYCSPCFSFNFHDNPETCYS